MNSINRVASVLSVCILAGCSGQVSNSDAGIPAAQNVVYPISAEAADRVIGQAMIAAFPEEPISPVSLPNRGYSSTIRFALDSHRVSAMAVPGTGQEPDGSKVSGYSFRVTHAGTMPISGSKRSAALFAAINQQAAAIHAPVPSASK